MTVTVEYNSGVRFSFSPDVTGRAAIMAAVQREAQRQIDYAAECAKREKRHNAEAKAFKKKRATE